MPGDYRYDELTDGLMDLYREVRDSMGFYSRPYGDDYADLVEDLADAVKARFDLSAIDGDVMDILENENFHTLCEAVEVACGQASADAIRERERERYEMYAAHDGKRRK